MSKIITYAESKREKPFDWNLFLNMKSHYYEELKEARILAKGWVTCACGNQCSIIQRNHNGRPYDFTLRELGYDFTKAINQMEFPDSYFYKQGKEQAKQILVLIEKRSAELIADILKQF